MGQGFAEPIPVTIGVPRLKAEFAELELEKNSRAQLQKLAKERAMAEASGVSQMAGLQGS